MNPTEHLMELARLARLTTDKDDLRRILREGNDCYHQGLQEMRDHVGLEVSGLSDLELAERLPSKINAHAAGATREENVARWSFERWEDTPAAMSFASIAQHAAEQGVCLLPEE